MAASNKYYYDFSRAGVRYRLLFLPPSASYYGDVGTAPSFRGDPVDSVYVRIPSHVIFFPGDTLTEASYDTIPIGLPEFSNLKLGVILSKLEDGDVLEELATVIVNPKVDAALTVMGESIATYTSVVLFTDAGNGALDVDDFLALFAGQLRKGLPAKLKRSSSSGNVYLEREVTSLFYSVLSDMTPSQVRYSLLNGSYTAKGPYTETNELYFTGSDGPNRTYRFVRRNSNLQATLHRWVDIWAAIREVAVDIASLYMRRAITFNLHSFLGTSNPNGGTIGTPYDMYRLYPYAYSGSTFSNDLGAPLALSDWYVITRIQQVTAPTVDVAGYITDAGEGSKGLFSYKKMLEFFLDCCGSGVCRVVPSYSSGYQTATLYFAAIYEYYGGSLSTLGLDNAIGDAREVALGESVQLSASSDVAFATDTEPSTLEYSVGSEEQSAYSTRSPLHNLPDLKRPTGGGLYASTSTLYSAGFRESAVYHLSSVTGSEAPHLVHFGAYWWDGTQYKAPIGLSALIATLGAFTEPFSVFGGFDEALSKVYGQIIVGLGEAANGTIPRMSSQMIVDNFANELQSLYEAEYKTARVGVDLLGRRCGNTTFPNANAILASGETAKGYLIFAPAAPVVLAAQPDIKRGTVKTKLLAFKSG